MTDPLDTGVSPTQVRVDYLTVNRDLLRGVLETLFRSLPKCRRRGCGEIALYEAQVSTRSRGGFMPRKALPVCGAHATEDEKHRAIEGADWIAVATQLWRECR
jgi:hypothetical protein